MASIANDKNGCRRIQFVAPDGRRLTIRLGKVSKRAAENIKYRVEQLLESLNLNRPMEADLASWVKGLEPPLAKKLARVGLIPEQGARGSVTIGAFLHAYAEKRTDVKQSTQTNWGHTRRLLLAFFGETQPLNSITSGDARDWERWLRTSAARDHRYGDNDEDQGLAPNTARKRVSNAKQFFEDAVRRELLTRNPFTGLKGTVGSNRERDYFLTREDTDKIIEACPDHEWRLIIALSRYGGLRCPSEHVGLRWSDIDWDRCEMRVRSPKTEHHEGKGSRLVPIFSELRPYLDTAWERSEPGADFIITRYRAAAQNLRTTFQKIIHRAGLMPWPKLFQNLRASRATELAAEHPAHVAAKWLGHSTLVAQKHYWQVTDADFDRAVGRGGEKAAQKAAQSVHAGSRTEPQPVGEQARKPREMRDLATLCDTVPMYTVGDKGLEPLTPCL